jgi:hypothetical protein
MPNRLRSDRTGADRHDPGDECHAAGDGVQNHGSGEAVGRAGFDVGKLRAVHVGNDMSGLISDVAT